MHKKSWIPMIHSILSYSLMNAQSFWNNTDLYATKRSTSHWKENQSLNIHLKYTYGQESTQREVPYFFTYKLSDFSVFATKVWEIFSQQIGFGLLPRVWDSKTSTNLMLMRNDRKFRYCSALYVTCFKIDMITMYFWTPIRFFASHALKDDLTQLGCGAIDS